MYYISRVARFMFITFVTITIISSVSTCGGRFRYLHDLRVAGQVVACLHYRVHLLHHAQVLWCLSPTKSPLESIILSALCLVEYACIFEGKNEKLCTHLRGSRENEGHL